MDYKTMTETRQSCRNYAASGTVTRAEMENILEAGRLAPSACNRQPYHFYAITGENARRAAKAAQVSGFNRFTDNCPAFIAVAECPPAADAPDDRKQTFEKYASIDIGLTVSQMVYRAQELGLSSCILGAFDGEKLRSVLNTTAHIRLMIALGHAAPDDPLRVKSRRAPEDLITWI